MWNFLPLYGLPQRTALDVHIPDALLANPSHPPGGSDAGIKPGEIRVEGTL